MKTRYTRTRNGIMKFLKPYESFCKYDGADGYLDSDTSCRKWVRDIIQDLFHCFMDGREKLPK